MSRILIISKEIPYPPHRNGACNSLYNYVSCWEKAGYNIKVLYLTSQETTAEERLKEIFRIDVESINLTGSMAFTKINKVIVLKPRNSWSIDSGKCPIIDTSGFDYIIWGSLATTVIHDKIMQFEGKQILFAADSLSLYYRRELHQRRGFIRKLYSFSQEIISKKYESLIYSTIKNVVFVSDVDKQYASNNFDGHFVENRIGVNIPQKYVKTIDEINEKEVIDIGFSGIMDYEPNAMAVEYIISKIMPCLDRLGLRYKMHIIGKNPKDEWKKTVYFKNGRLLITGFIDNMEAYISQMDMYISPLFLGTGMKNKILQAMGLGVPIICSKTSAEGIEGLVDGKNMIIVPDKVEDWGRAIKLLSADIYRRRAFSESCKEVIQNRYTWEQSAKRMLEI